MEKVVISECQLHQGDGKEGLVVRESPGCLSGVVV